MSSNPAAASQVLDHLNELCELESTRQTRILSKHEHARWLALQKLLTPALCNVATAGGEDRRTTLRVPCPLDVKVQSADAAFIGTAIDVSAGGIGVRSQLLPAVGERVTLVHAEEPKGQHFALELPGHVVWLRKIPHALGAGFGVAFAPVDHEHDRRLAQLLLFLLRRERDRLQLPATR